MAVAFRGVSALNIGSAGVSCAIPAAAVTDDILLLLVMTAEEAVTVANQNGGTWVEIPDSPQGQGTPGAAGAVRLTVFWSRHNGTQGNPTTSDSGTINAVVMLAYSGCILTGDPWDVTAGDTQAATTAGSIPGDTTTVDGCMIVGMVATDLDLSSSTNATGFTNASLASITERFDQTSATGVGGGFTACDGIKTTAGAVSASTWTQANSAALCNIMIALKPPTTTQALTGSLFSKAPTFFTGVVTPGAVALTGSLFTKAPTFPTGVVTATYNLTGVLFAKTPTFPQGTITTGAVALTGTLFTKAPTFFTGTVTSGAVTLTGVLFQKAPTFPQGAVTTGAAALTGTLFVKAPTFPQGTVTAGVVNLSGVLFQKAPTFPTGAVTTTVTLTGTLFVKAPTFPTGTIGQAGTLFGNLFTKAPTFFTGSLAQGGPSFWQPNPVGWTANPAGFVRVGRYGPSPWGAELSGQRFEKAPTFPVGAVS